MAASLAASGTKTSKAAISRAGQLSEVIANIPGSARAADLWERVVSDLADRVGGKPDGAGTGGDGYGAGGNTDKGGDGYGAGGNTDKGGDGYGTGGNTDKGGDGYGAGGNNDKGGDGYGAGGNPDRGGDGYGAGGNPDKNGDGEGDGDGIPDKPDDAGNPGHGKGDGTGDGDGISDKPAPAPTPPDVPLLDPETVQYKAGYTFKVGDITVGWGGETLATRPESLSDSVAMTTKAGVEMYAVDNEFGFYVTDFIGAQPKVFDGDFGEGFVGELADGGIAVSNARTVTFSVPARFGTWLEGIGGNFVKASTEHYTVMQAILSDQAYPGDTSGYYQLDDDLWIVDYRTGDDGMPVDEAGNPSSSLVDDAMHGFYVKELIGALEDAGGYTAPTELWKDFDRDGTDDLYAAYMTDMEIDGVTRNVAVVDIGNDGTIDYYDGNLNGFGTYGLADVLKPNESSIIEDIAVGDDYSVTLKDDGKLLYRWGNAVKRPNDMRIDAKLDLPDEWQTDADGDGFADVLFRITAAELVVNHTVTNNPNDQIRPEDFENEAAIGILPSYEVDANGNWVSINDYYAGDGTFLPMGTILRDFSLIDAVDGSMLDTIGGLSSDLLGGFTEAWYTTMDREPFMADLTEDGTAYDIGPRWRLQPDKFGQDLPSVIIPQDPSEAPPVANGEEKYEVGVDTTTVLNLLDWNGTSPMTLSAGWITGAGEVSANGVNMTEDFDVAFYIKGDMKPVNLYDAELLMEYEEVAIEVAGVDVVGSTSGDTLVGSGSNAFYLSGAGSGTADGEADLLVLGYGELTAAGVGANEVYAFGAEEGDAVGLIGFDLDPDNYNIHLTQKIVDQDLELSFDGTQIATLYGVDEYLDADAFYFA
ncbi:hypothetical protein [Tropicimonas sediminicola]|uniref:hypothetical protein n=1 Tax=Tropicimonas sediminicola TaxID=1031541 RepID=UPI000B778D4F|nr:hypothetical protein [Tropicimonas sediminicola]